MLVNLKETLDLANEMKIALGAFNTPNMTSLKAVISAAEELNLPVVIMHAQVHEDIGVCKLDDIAGLMVHFAKNAKVPVCVHLDHGEDFDYIKRALDLGFTSVMYDGSTLSGEENIENTKKVVELAKKYNASVEAEIGSMGSREWEEEKTESVYTEPHEAAEFAAKTKVDALTCAFGTAHGTYKSEPKLDFERVSNISAAMDVPVVMHGGSGISDKDFKEVIKRGVRKINYYTYMARAGAEAVAGKEYTQFHDILKDAEIGMKENVKQAMRVFANMD